MSLRVVVVVSIGGHSQHAAKMATKKVIGRQKGFFLLPADSPDDRRGTKLRCNIIIIRVQRGRPDDGGGDCDGAACAPASSLQQSQTLLLQDWNSAASTSTVSPLSPRSSQTAGCVAHCRCSSSTVQ